MYGSDSIRIIWRFKDGDKEYVNMDLPWLFLGIFSFKTRPQGVVGEPNLSSKLTETPIFTIAKNFNVCLKYMPRQTLYLRVRYKFERVNKAYEQND